MILAMLGSVPRRRRKSTAHSSSSATGGRPPRAHLSEASQSSHERAVRGAIGEAYGRFLELPVPVVLAMLWLLGAIVLLGLVLGVVSLAAVALA